MARVRTMATPATPPTAPPTMAPTFVSSPSLSGADPASAEVSEADVLSAVPLVEDELVEVDVSDVLSAVLSSLVEDDVVDVAELLSEEESVVRARVRVPIVVGSDSDVADAVKAAETLAMLRLSIPDPETATVLANEDAEPHPYWKKSPSNWFW